MILKGSQRANGADLATHLMQAVDNETVEIAQIYGTVSTDLHGAFAEMEAVASGTKAKNYLYSLSINPSAPMTRPQYFEAIDIIEDRQGLTGQPRVVVFHVKDGREHCHVVWSKIDAVNMKAIHMAYDHAKLCDLSCELAHKYGLDLPPGLRAWEANNPLLRYWLSEQQLEASMAENAIAKETGVTPAQREAEITAAYHSADTPRAFQAALVEAGYIVAQGDKRRYVVVDRFAKVHSLTRYIKGHTAKSINHRLQAALAFADLPTVDEVKNYVREHQQEIEERREAKVKRQTDWARDALKAQHKYRRVPLEAKEQDLLVRHAAERMALHAAQKTERQSLPKVVLSAAGRLLYRVRNMVARLLSRTPGLRSVLGPITGDQELGLARRHELEEQALARRHQAERAMAEREKRSMDAVEAREIKTLKQTLRRKIRQTDSHSPSLMTHLRHEDEPLHDIHDRLVFERGRLLWEQGLSPPFNFSAGVEKKRDDDERRRLGLLWEFALASTGKSGDGKGGKGDGETEAPAPMSELKMRRRARRDEEQPAPAPQPLPGGGRRKPRDDDDTFDEYEREYEQMCRDGDEQDFDGDFEDYERRWRKHRPRPRPPRGPRPRPKPGFKRRR